MELKWKRLVRSLKKSAKKFAANNEFFRLRTTRFISRSLTLLSIGTALSEQKTFNSAH